MPDFHSTEQELASLRSIQLSEDSRMRMREELLAYARLHAFQKIARERQATSFFVLRRMYAFSTLALVLIVTGATSVAASGSLPGDTLYPIKVRIAEPLQTALTPTAKGKAVWHNVLVERRLEEAATLAVRDDLDPQTQQELESAVSEQVQASLATADGIEAEGDVSSSLDIRSDLEARLTAHANIFTALADHLADTETSTGTDDSADGNAETARHILSIIEAHEDAVADTRIAREGEDTVATVATVEEPKVVAVAVDSQATEAPTLMMAAKLAPVSTTTEDDSIAEPRMLMKQAVMATDVDEETPTAASTEAELSPRERRARARQQEIRAILERNRPLLESFQNKDSEESDKNDENN